jgi:hypothetical protein
MHVPLFPTPCSCVTALQCTLRECEVLRSLCSHEFACYVCTQETYICNLDENKLN